MPNAKSQGWTAIDVANTAERSRRYLEDSLKRLARATFDRERARRVAMRECQWCYYCRHGVAGQGFTAYTCRACRVEHHHPNTATPALCDPCADTLEACVTCGGTREWKTPSVDGAAEANELFALRAVAGAARGVLNAATAAVSRYRRKHLAAALDVWEAMLPEQPEVHP